MDACVKMAACGTSDIIKTGAQFQASVNYGNNKQTGKREKKKKKRTQKKYKKDKINITAVTSSNDVKK